MMEIPEHEELDVSETTKTQERLSQYVKSFEIEYRHKNQVSSPSVSKKMAEYLNLSLARYYDLRGTSKPNPKLMTAINYFGRFAKLRNLSVVEFVGYLCSEQPRFSETGALTSPLSGWEDNLLRAFDGISIKSRSRFMKTCQKYKRDPLEFQRILDLVTVASEVDIDAAEQIIKTLAKLKNKLVD